MNRSPINPATHFHLPYRSDLVDRARELRKNPTPAEHKLWRDCLRRFPYRVLRQRPIDRFIVDFYCAQLNLVIEIDGDTHFTPQGKAQDQSRSAILTSYGLKIMRFTNTEVFENFVEVCDRLLGEIPLNPL